MINNNDKIVEKYNYTHVYKIFVIFYDIKNV